jgi:hypothetical protein
MSQPTTIRVFGNQGRKTFRHSIDEIRRQRTFMVRRRTHDFEVSVGPVQSIKTMRLIAEEFNWSCRRLEGSRLVDRFAIIMPMAQATRTLTLQVTTGPFSGLELCAWAETRGSSGAINIVSWTLPQGIEHAPNQDLIRLWASRCDRCPWQWTFGERSKIGGLLPVWRRAKKKFANIGLDVGKRGWPISEELIPTFDIFEEEE